MQDARNVRGRAGRQFWVLASLLCIVFLTGGNSRGDVPALMLLRPLSIWVAIYGIATLEAEHWRQYRPVAILTAAILLLTAAHLIPLPYSIWAHLPGRELIREIDTFTPGAKNWRPLSMVPEATFNALYSLAVPVGVLALSAQQDKAGRLHLLWLLIVLFGLSGLVGLLQASGASFWAESAGHEVSGLFANRNHQGTILALLLPMLGVASAARMQEHPRQKWPLSAALALAGVVIVLVVVTGSRSALALALASSLLTPLILHRALPKSDRRGTRRSHARELAIRTGLIAMFIGGLIFLTIFSARDQVISRIGQAMNDPRYAVWGTVMEAAPNFMPWGTGIGSYADVYQTFEPSETLRPTYSNHAHNEWLEIALTAGVPGMLLALAAVALFVAGLRKSIQATGWHALLSRLGLAMIALIALASITDYPARTPIVASALAVAAIWASSSKRYGNDLAPN